MEILEMKHEYDLEFRKDKSTFWSHHGEMCAFPQLKHRVQNTE